MVNIMNSNYMGVVELSCLSKDLSQIKSEYSKDYYATGSSLLVVDTRKVYLWDKENKRWLDSKGVAL